MNTDITPYQSLIKHIWSLSDQVQAIKAREYADAKKYDEPVRVKLLKETREFAETIQAYQQGTTNNDTGKSFDIIDILLELADIGYYNTVDYRNNLDARDFLAVQQLYCEQMLPLLAELTIRVDISMSLQITIAKYGVRVAHAGLKQRNRVEAVRLEREAVEQIFS